MSDWLNKLKGVTTRTKNSNINVLDYAEGVKVFPLTDSRTYLRRYGYGERLSELQNNVTA